jgi:hypothetical protein
MASGSVSKISTVLDQKLAFSSKNHQKTIKNILLDPFNLTKLQE